MSFSMSRCIASAFLVLTLSAGVAGAQSRVVSLTPHATELLFAAGAGSWLAGRVAASDYPLAARQVPAVGDGLTTSAEAVLRARPDWVIGWPSPLLDRLQALGVKTIALDPQTLRAIPEGIERLGQALGTAAFATASANALRAQIEVLEAASTSEPVRVAVLASAEGDFVLGRQGLINDALRHCGAVNAFGASPSAAPSVSRESLMAARPQLVLSGYPLPAWVRDQFAVRQIPADWLYRPGPRFIQAAQAICEATRQVGQSNHPR